MSLTIIFSMIAFSFAMSISPGPVNMLIISSGINHGFKYTFSFVSGATIGFTLLLVLISFGFFVVIDEYPLFLKVLSILGSSFIIYLGYKIATSSSKLSIDEKDKKRLKFYEGFLLQWLNPKAWIASLSGISMFSSTTQELVVFIIIYFIVCYLSLSFWAVFGAKASIFLNTSIRLKVFNIVMGGTLIITAFFLLINVLYE